MQSPAVAPRIATRYRERVPNCWAGGAVIQEELRVVAERRDAGFGPAHGQRGQRNVRRDMALAGALFIASILLSCRSAFAHAELLRSEPPAGASVVDPPHDVRLTFTDALAPESSIDVVDDGFRPVAIGPASLLGDDPFTLRVALMPLAAGDYTVQYRAVEAQDGHAVEGSFGFRVSGPGGPAASRATSRWPIAGGAGVVAAIFLLGWLALRRRWPSVPP